MFCGFNCSLGLKKFIKISISRFKIYVFVFYVIQSDI